MQDAGLICFIAEMKIKVSQSKGYKNLNWFLWIDCALKEGAAARVLRSFVQACVGDRFSPLKAALSTAEFIMTNPWGEDAQGLAVVELV